MKNLKTIIIALFAISLMVSCSSDSLDPSIEQEKSVEGSIASVSDVRGIVLGAYNRMTGSGYYGRNYIIFGEVRTDNTFANGNSGRFVEPGRFKLQATYSDPTDAWSDMYRVIASANIVISTDSEALIGDLDEFAHYKGQALTMRALAHFDALKLFGQKQSNGTEGIPYITEYKGEDLIPARLTIEETKTLIIQDLMDAKGLMARSYDDPAKQMFGSTSPDALLSRVYLYFGMWTEARDAAKNVMNTGLYSIIDEATFVSSFGSDSPINSIMALAYSETDNSGNGGLGFIYKGDTYGDIEVLDNAAEIFEEDDVRGMGGILGMEGDRIRNLGKYPTLNGYDDVDLIRYEEIVLNYAEALWRIDSSDPNVLVQLNSITSQRGAESLTSVDLDVILNERRKELMFEGFRFDDLMRNGMSIEKIDSNQGFDSTVPYGDSRLSFPIPDDEMNANSNMVQNEGY